MQLHTTFIGFLSSLWMMNLSGKVVSNPLISLLYGSISLSSLLSVIGLFVCGFETKASSQMKYFKLCRSFKYKRRVANDFWSLWWFSGMDKGSLIIYTVHRKCQCFDGHSHPVKGESSGIVITGKCNWIHLLGCVLSRIWQEQFL